MWCWNLWCWLCPGNVLLDSIDPIFTHQIYSLWSTMACVTLCQRFLEDLMDFVGVLYISSTSKSSPISSAWGISPFRMIFNTWMTKIDSSIVLTLLKITFLWEKLIMGPCFWPVSWLQDFVTDYLLACLSLIYQHIWWVKLWCCQFKLSSLQLIYCWFCFFTKYGKVIII